MYKGFLLVTLLFVATRVHAQEKKFVIETDSGRIVIALTDNTPKHRDNMIKLIQEKFFDSLMFHRIIPGFVIQGGDPQSKSAQPGQMLGEGEIGYKIPAEINDSNFHHRGALGMARDNNPEKASSACQFYIVTGRPVADKDFDILGLRGGRVFTPSQRERYKKEGGTPMLDGNYTVYGYVVEGMEVVERISQMPRNNADRPNTDIRMNRVYMLENPSSKKNKKKSAKK